MVAAGVRAVRRKGRTGAMHGGRETRAMLVCSGEHALRKDVLLEGQRKSCMRRCGEHVLGGTEEKGAARAA